MFTPRKPRIMSDGGLRMADVGKAIPYIRHPQSAIRNSSWRSPQYVTNQDQNTENHHQRVVLRIAGLNEPYGPAERPDESTDEFDQAIDNIFIPPIGAVGTPCRCQRRTVNKAVDNICVKPPQQSSRTLRAVHEKHVVKFIH